LRLCAGDLISTATASAADANREGLGYIAVMALRNTAQHSTAQHASDGHTSHCCSRRRQGRVEVHRSNGPAEHTPAMDQLTAVPDMTCNCGLLDIRLHFLITIGSADDRRVAGETPPDSGFLRVYSTLHTPIK
jgi:hypothetical protein